MEGACELSSSPFPKSNPTNLEYTTLQLNDNRTFARLDPEDAFDLGQYSWRLNNIGYAIRHTTINRKAKSYLMHRVIMKAQKGEVIDHINGDKLDNRKCNLRKTDQSSNRMNMIKRTPTASKHKGVRRQQRGKPWYARIRSRPDDTQKERFLGAFDDEHQAALMYDFWALELFGEYAHPNFPVVAHNFY
jgi:hypothetical protein